LLIFETRDSLLTGVVIMVLLRPTNRMQALLAGHGYELSHSDMSLRSRYRPNEWEMVIDYMNRFGVTEADYRIAENMPSDADSFHSIRKRFESYGNGDGLAMKRVNGTANHGTKRTHGLS
jgi:hypothetical protein